MAGKGQGWSLPPGPTNMELVAGGSLLLGNFCAHMCAHTCTAGFWKWGPQEGNDVILGIYSLGGRIDENGPAMALAGPGRWVHENWLWSSLSTYMFENALNKS